METEEHPEREMEMKEQADGWLFLTSLRGRYILWQALQYAIAEMEKVEDRFQQKSNIADMKLIRDTVCEMFEKTNHVEHGYVDGLSSEIKKLNNNERGE